MPYIAKSKTKKERRIPKQARAIERVNKILDTAAELLAQPKQNKVSTHQIAEKAGVSIGSVYQFFPNIESVKIALIERLLNQYYVHFDATITHNPNINDLAELSTLLVDATFHFYQQHPDIVRHIVSINDSQEFAHVNAKLNERISTRVIEHFAQSTPNMDEHTVRRRLSVVIALGDLMTMSIWSSNNQADRDAFLDEWKKLTAYYSKLD